MNNRYGLRVYGHQMSAGGPKIPLRIHNSQFNFVSGYGDFRFLDDWVDDTDKANPKPRILDKMVNGKLYPSMISPDRAKLLSESIKAHAPLMTPHTVVRHHEDFANYDCLMVGPGPSSAGIAERIRKLNESGKLHRPLVVVALNRAGMLRDLNPHMFMCLDAHSKPEWWAGLDPMITGLITCPMAPPELAAYWSPKVGRPNCHYFYLRDCGQPEHPAFAPLPMMSGAYSVSVVALHVLAVMGFKRIFMVGLDLSCVLDEDGRKDGKAVDMVMYGDGTKGSQTYMNGAMVIETVGLDGQLCVAETQFFQQREAMKVQMEQVWDSGIEVYNASGRGILDYRAFNLEEGLARPLEATSCPTASPVLPSLTATRCVPPSTLSAPQPSS